MVVFLNTSFIVYNTNIVNKFSDFNLSLCTFINTSIVNYVSGRNLTDMTTTNNYNTSTCAFINSSITIIQVLHQLYHLIILAFVHL